MILSQSNTFTCVLWEVVQLNRMTQHKNRELFFRKPRKLRLLHHLLAKPKDTIFKCWFHFKPKSQMIAKISKFRVAQLQHRELQTLSTPHTALHLPCPCPPCALMVTRLQLCSLKSQDVLLSAQEKLRMMTRSIDWTRHKSLSYTFRTSSSNEWCWLTF